MDSRFVGPIPSKKARWWGLAAKSIRREAHLAFPASARPISWVEALGGDLQPPPFQEQGRHPALHPPDGGRETPAGNSLPKRMLSRHLRPSPSRKSSSRARVRERRAMASFAPGWTASNREHLVTHPVAAVDIPQKLLLSVT